VYKRQVPQFFPCRISSSDGDVQVDFADATEFGVFFGAMRRMYAYWNMTGQVLRSAVESAVSVAEVQAVVDTRVWPLMPVVRYLFNQASAGTGPTVLNDDLHVAPAPISYGVGDAEGVWSSIAAGDGLRFLVMAGSAVALQEDNSGAVSAGAFFNEATEGTMIVESDISDSDWGGSRVFSLTSNGGNTEFGMVVTPGQLWIRWGRELGGGQAVYDHTAGVGGEVYGRHTFVAVIDSKEAVAADRCHLYIDGVEVVLAGCDIPLNEAVLTKQASIDIAVGNRPEGGGAALATLYNAEMRLDKLDATQAALVNTNLVADNNQQCI